MTADTGVYLASHPALPYNGCMTELFRPGFDSFPGKKALQAVCEVVDDLREQNASVFTFKYDIASTTIRIERAADSLVITNMTTLPSSEQAKGYGKASVQALLNWAAEHGFSEVTATQVQRESAGFWQNCGFVKIKNSPTNDYVFVPTGAAFPADLG